MPFHRKVKNQRQANQSKKEAQHLTWALAAMGA